MLGKLGVFIVAVPVVYLVIAALLIVSGRPPLNPAPQEQGMSFAEAIAVDYSDLPDLQTFTARDGVPLPYRVYHSAEPGGMRVVMVHGSAWHGMQFHAMAKAVAEAGIADVYVPDMRGHGATPERRGDINYVSQLEDDVADLVDHIRAAEGAGRLVILGHSSGGGFVVRYAGGTYGETADAYVLLAPFLKHDAPTTKENSGGWARPAVRRIIGLSMLNQVGLTLFNHLPVISFAMPENVLNGPLGHTATTQYSFAMNTGFAPRDYEIDFKNVSKPFLVMAGTNDSSFRAELYEPTLSALNAVGTYKVLEGLSHIGVVTEPAAIEELKGWLQSLN